MSFYTSGYTGVEIDEGLRRTYEVFSNRNLLHNWDFRNPVNQRGIVSGATISTPAYFLDGWKLISGSCIWTVGQRLSVANASVVMFYMEKFYGMMLDETYTFSVDTSDGIKSVTFKFPSAVSGATVYTETGITGYCTIKAGFEYRAGGEIICGATLYYVPYIEITATDDIELIPWLEQNSVSTMANATQPDFGEQLALCQRYFRRLSYEQYSAIGILSVIATWKSLFIGLRQMRLSNPTVTITGTIVDASNAVALPSLHTNANILGDQLCVGFSESGTAHTNYCYAADAGGCTIDVNCEV